MDDDIRKGGDRVQKAVAEVGTWMKAGEVSWDRVEGEVRRKLEEHFPKRSTRDWTEDEEAKEEIARMLNSEGQGEGC